jgi:hypothetical protein
MTLFELVDNLCRSDIARYVALARVLERATEEQMVELDKLFAKYKIDLIEFASETVLGELDEFLIDRGTSLRVILSTVCLDAIVLYIIGDKVGCLVIW